MLGIGGWSPGYQSAGAKSSRICAGVKAKLLPGRCSNVEESSGAEAIEAAGSGVAPGPGGVVKPYAHGGGGSVASCCGGVAPVAATRSTASIEAHKQFLIEPHLSTLFRADSTPKGVEPRNTNHDAEESPERRSQLPTAAKYPKLPLRRFLVSMGYTPFLI
jgi:hypothetical protein